MNGYSLSFSSSNQRLDDIGKYLAAKENNKNEDKSGIRSDSNTEIFSSKFDKKVCKATKISELATGADSNFSIINEASLRGLSYRSTKAL